MFRLTFKNLLANKVRFALTTFGVMLAVPIGTIQAYRQYSWFDNVGTVFTMLGFSVPVFVIGPMFIWFFSVKLQWLPTFYTTTHDLDWTSWSSI